MIIVQTCQSLTDKIRCMFGGFKNKDTNSKNRHSFPQSLTKNGPASIEEFHDKISSKMICPEKFLQYICTYYKNTIFLRLFHLEYLMEKDIEIVDFFANMNRNIVDKVISYEYQNIRAYFYYLIFRSRIFEHKKTVIFNQIIDMSFFSFDLDKVLAEIIENNRFGSLLTVFLDYTHVPLDNNLSEAIFQNRVNLFENIIEENICYMIVLIVHFYLKKTKITTKEILDVLRSFQTLAEKFISEVKNADLSFDFENNFKKVFKNEVEPMIFLFQRIVMTKKKGVKTNLEDIQLSIKFIIKLQLNRPHLSSMFESLKMLLNEKLINVHENEEVEKTDTLRKRVSSDYKLVRTPLLFQEDEQMFRKMSENKFTLQFEGNKIIEARMSEEETNSIYGRCSRKKFDFDTILQDDPVERKN